MNNPPAFPQHEQFTKGAWENGMTLRDYFAAEALPGLIALYGQYPDYERIVSTEAYGIADAMLEKREEP